MNLDLKKKSGHHRKANKMFKEVITEEKDDSVPEEETKQKSILDIVGKAFSPPLPIEGVNVLKIAKVLCAPLKDSVNLGDLLNSKT